MKVVLLNSGGVDTLAVAKMYKDQGHEVHSLYISLGQENNKKASTAAKKIAKEYCASHHSVEVSGLAPIVINGFLTMPFQMLTIFVIGACYARQIGCDYIASGNKKQVISDNFKQMFADYLRTSRITEPVIPMMPLAEYGSMKEVYDFVKDEPLLKQTVSCNHKELCKTCIKCIERQQLGIDPIS
jgi:7-cyano-7-deazaguanine synthase in queuosine biosynthesis